MRSAGSYSRNICNVDYDGYVGVNYSTYSSHLGIRPAFNLNLTSAITQCAVSDTGYADYTIETYKMNADGTTYEKSQQTKSAMISTNVTAEYTVPDNFTFNAEKSVLSGNVKANGSLVLKVYLDRSKYKLKTVVDKTETETEYYYGQAITVSDPTKTGYNFVGWSPEIPATMPANALTVTANFTEKSGYTVKFDSDGGSEVTAKANVKWTDKVLDGRSNPTKQGYTFTGWYSGTDKVTEETTYASLVANDKVMGVELKATWLDIENPVISGLENGATYCEGKTFTVSDNGGIASVSANGVGLVPDSTGKYTLEAANGEVVITVTDLDGNETTITVTVNEHNYKLGECTECGAKDPDACWVVKFFRYVVNWFTAFIKSCVKWLREMPVSLAEWFKAVFGTVR